MNKIYKIKTKTGKNVVIRYPQMRDLEKMLNYINTLSDERTYITYQGEHETLDSERKFLQKRLKDIKNKKAVNLLAFSGGKLIAVTDIHLLDRVQKHIGNFGLTVLKEYRSQGLGKIMTELIEKEAKKELPDLKIIILEVFSTNNIAKKLYKKMGFTKYGLLPKGIYRNNSFEDGVLMYKPVRN